MINIWWPGVVIFLCFVAIGLALTIRSLSEEIQELRRELAEARRHHGVLEKFYAGRQAWTLTLESRLGNILVGLDKLILADKATSQHDKVP